MYRHPNFHSTFWCLHSDAGSIFWIGGVGWGRGGQNQVFLLVFYCLWTKFYLSQILRSVLFTILAWAPSVSLPSILMRGLTSPAIRICTWGCSGPPSCTPDSGVPGLASWPLHMAEPEHFPPTTLFTEAIFSDDCHNIEWFVTQAFELRSREALLLKWSYVQNNTWPCWTTAHKKDSVWQCGTDTKLDSCVHTRCSTCAASPKANQPTRLSTRSSSKLQHLSCTPFTLHTYVISRKEWCLSSKSVVPRSMRHSTYLKLVCNSYRNTALLPKK